MDLLKELGEIAIGSRLKRVSDRINLEISKLFKKQGIDIEPSWLPVLLFLADTGTASIQEIAVSLKFTHPAVIHLLKQAEKRKLITETPDKNDRRRRYVSLSEDGRKLLDTAESLLGNIREAVKELLTAPGNDFLLNIDLLEKSLNEKGLVKRTEDRIKERLINSVEILKYTPAYKEQFKTLNIEWLEKYFRVEKEDERILNNPGEIISGGGEIFFASLENEIIGTCAVIKKNSNEFELAKMAVTSKAQGKQAGKKLALAAIGFAYTNGANILTLETSRKLSAAVSLYEGIGFEYVHDNAVSKYERTTIKMKLDLK